jgi:hypothetical protein
LAKTTKIDAVTLTGQSGRTYEFGVYVWNNKFKPVPGVYVVASRSIEPGQPPRYEPVFVGATNDLSTAFANHPRGDCFQLYYANVLGVLRLADDSERAAVAADLIEALAPPCNASDVD